MSDANPRFIFRRTGGIGPSWNWWEPLTEEMRERIADEDNPNPKRKAESRRKREHREWLRSLEIRSDAPSITESVVLRSVVNGGPWRSIAILAQEQEDAVKRAERGPHRDRNCTDRPTSVSQGDRMKRTTRTILRGDRRAFSSRNFRSEDGTFKWARTASELGNGTEIILCGFR